MILARAAVVNADAAGHAQAGREVTAIDRLHRSAYPLRNLATNIELDTRQQQCEFLATPARHMSGRVGLGGAFSEHTAQRSGNRIECVVAGLMRIAVVDALEIVAVEQGKTQRPVLGAALARKSVV